jgi:cytochrome P450
VPDLVRRTPERSAEAVEELLRLETPNEGFAREATRDIEIGGQLIKQGERVAVVFTSGNRDAAAFESPDEFRLGREGLATKTLAFGHGAHKCPGTAVSRSEVRIFVEELLARTSHFEVAGDISYSGFPVYGPTSLPIRVTSA